MRSILGILLLGLLALAGSWLLGRLSRGRTGLGPLSSGMLFLPLGVLLGPAVSGVLDARAAADLELIKVLGVGWIGFLFGLHLEWRLLKRLASRLYLLTAAQSLAAMLAVFVALELIRFQAADAGSAAGVAGTILAGPLILAACAAGSAPNRAFRLAAHRRPDATTGKTLATIASLDDLPGLLLFGLFFALASKPGGAAETGLGGLLWLPLSIGLGFVAALVLREILPARPQPRTNLALILGVIAFFSGAAGVLRLSPLFLGVAGGAVFANLSVRKEAVFEVLGASERTIYLLFLLTVGAQWDPSRAAGLLWPAALFVAARGLAKIGLPALLKKLGRSPTKAEPSRWMGLGLLGQGGLVLAMALDYQRAFHGELVSDVLTVLILAMLLNELLAWPAALWLARKGGDR